MYWYKVKNILIVLFALINVFLIAIIMNSNTSEKREEKELAQSLVSVLSANDVQIAQGVLSDEKPFMSLYSVENEVEDSVDFARKIIGEDAEAAVDESDTPYYRSGTSVLYTQNGSFAMSDSSLEPTTQTDSDAATARAFFENAGFDMSRARCTPAKDRIEFTFYINERPLFVNTLYASVAQGKVVRCGGFILRILQELGKPQEVSAQALALTDFLRDDKRPQKPLVITDISVGYSILLGDKSVNFKSAEAVATYRITTSDGENYYYAANKR